MSTAQTDGFLLQEKVLELSAMLTERHPKMPTLLAEIHRTLQKYPEQVTLMDEDQIRIVVEGLKVQTGVQFAAAAATGKTSTVSNLKNKIASKGVDAF